MASPLIPWEPCNFPEEVQAELNRRKINRSLNYVNASKGEWSDGTGDWELYRGPMVPWVRCCSNGIGRYNPWSGDYDKQGFVFFGGKEFYSSYGFSKTFQAGKNNMGIIGYMPDGHPHTIENDLNISDYPIHVPPPEIERISATIQKEHYRRVTMEWVCFSKAQLEYMTPYFLVPGISCIIEWGWNHFDPQSLLDLRDTQMLQKRFQNPYPLYTKHILKSRGNYDVIFGIITHFEWSIEGNKIKCKTEVTSKDRIYSGLIIDSSVTEKKKDSDEEVPLGKLTEFVDKNLPLFKLVNSNKSPESIPGLQDFITYIKSRRKNWKEYVYGVFYGRDMEDVKNPFQADANKTYDFDYANGKNSELWLNLGLVIESINFHSAPLKGMAKKEMFSVDIDDVVIGGHPNMISSDGAVCLIPNAEAPKYFYGKYGTLVDGFDKKIKPNTNPIIPLTTRDSSPSADWRVASVCGQGKNCYRDNLDEIINHIRYEKSDVIKINERISFEFPFICDRNIVSNSKPYPARYSGYLKNIYVSYSFLKDLLNRSDEIKTYPRFIEKIMEGINSACGNFWDFRLVDATGSDDLDPDESAQMKIIDYKFMYFANRGEVYTFDYMDSDSLLLGLGFKPTLSNAAAIRSIYAQSNHPDKISTLTNGNNELLDYHFKDRLFQSQDKKEEPSKDKDSESFKETMRSLQQIEPRSNSYQITCSSNGKVVVRRLVLPDTQLLSILLDDGDEENNPKYTGIMPGIQANFTIQGIGGLRTFMMFLVRNLPEPYSHKNIIFRIVDVQESIESGKWITTITAGIIPLRGYIKKRLGIVD